MKLIGVYKTSQLAILNFTTAAGREKDPDHYEKVVDDVVRSLGLKNMSELVCAPDGDGTTHGPSRDCWAWNCLVLREDIDAWREAGIAHGYDVEDPGGEVGAGHYGDGHYEGIDLAQARPGELYWIDLM